MRSGILWGGGLYDFLLYFVVVLLILWWIHRREEKAKKAFDYDALEDAVEEIKHAKKKK